MTTSCLRPFLAALLLTGALAAQQASRRVEGGSWTWGDKKIEVSGATLSGHIETLRRLAPLQSKDDRLRAAWQRAVRIETARALGLGEDQAGFLRWMSEAHAGDQARLLQNGKPNRKILEAFARDRGFSSLAAYETFCRDEYRGRCLLDQLSPPRPIREAEVRERFDAMATEMLVDVIAVAPETLDEQLVPRPEDPKAREAYRNWYRLLPNRLKITFDDREHPALEAEAMYVNFRRRDPAELKTWFETKRPELKGASLADRTQHLVPTEKDETRLYRRWVEHRRRNYAYLNATLPSGLSDRESFERVREPLTITWKLVKYLEEAWQALAPRGPEVSLADEARRRGLAFRHLPMQVRAAIDNDAVLPGDHSQPLLKSTEPGAILDYNTGFDPEKIGPYLAQGVVDQPGLQASVFRLLRKEPMRVRSAEEVRERAWPEFVRYGRWQAAQQTARRLAQAWKRILAEEAKSTDEANRSRDARAVRSRAFTRFAKGAQQARIVRRLHVKPFGDRRPRARRDDALERRLQSFIEWRWSELAKAGPERDWAAGDVLDFVLGIDYQAAALVRIRVVRRPDERRWTLDRGLKERARRSLREDRDRDRITAADTLFSLEKLRREHDLKAPDLDALDEGK